jgi:transcription antitermination factor NusG
VKTSGVLRILGNGSFFIPVPEDQIQNLYALVTSKLPLEDHPYLKEGQRVVISSGPLRGVKGVLVRKERERILVVSVDLIQKGVSVKVAADAVEPLLSE